MNANVMHQIGSQLGDIEEIDSGEGGNFIGRFARVRISLNITTPLLKGVSVGVGEGIEDVMVGLDTTPKSVANANDSGIEPSEIDGTKEATKNPGNIERGSNTSQSKGSTLALTWIPEQPEDIGHTITNTMAASRRMQKIRRISSLAQLPIRRTPGAAGYDISIAYAQDIPAKGRSLLSTGICIQIPQNTYARIAPRSSTALQGIIIMGGVIDSDYRGEVKIMAFNTTNNDIFLNKQEYIAQLIIEYIATPTVREVEVLNSTPRGVSGFGSTTTRHGCSHIKADPKCTGCHYCCSDEEYAAEYPEYVAARPQPEELLVSQNFKGKEVMKIKPFPNEKLLAMQKKARQSMEPIRRRYNYNDSLQRGLGATGEQATYPDLPTPCGPYPLLDQYEELAEGIGPSTNTLYEKDKRQHMEHIESTAARNLLNSLWELKLIINAKEKDFSRRCQVKRGLYLYFQDALPEVMQTKGALLDTFIHVQGIVQKIKETPP
ncbi:hypothetical protein ZIOFF_019670 [Zingiber officinale]|uniref:dUTP diphosphatase n=1 Tax=Zingiber officinale TaxID=94328 RepID=A0A8J5H7C1_ZINOF|nr:hypothetical protein ZIOFF_019670 [Zingiber officinale]